MASLEEFQELLTKGNIEKAFTDYQLDFNEPVFDIFGDQEVKGYETEITWTFEKPNLIKMDKSISNGKKIYYLPWGSKRVTTVTLDGNSPPYFVTSHFSNCRFTMSFLDSQGKSVTVQHVAGDTGGGSLKKGTEERDRLEIKVPNVVRERRFSINGSKRVGNIGKNLMLERAKTGTTYYDTFARVFGVRGQSGSWVFYMQDINDKGQVLSFKNSD